MSRSRLLSSLAAGCLGIALLGACSSESITEFGLERALEAQGEDVDVEFTDDGFNVSTDEGDFSISLDDDGNGGIVFDIDEGSGSVGLGDDGIVFDTDEGSGSVGLGDGGIVFDTDAGSGTIEFTEDGGTFETEDASGSLRFEFDEATGAAGIAEGEMTFDDGTSIDFVSDAPDGWPVAIGLPETYNPTGSFFTTMEAPEGPTTMGTFQHDPAEDFASAVRDRLVASGYSSMQDLSGPAGHTVVLNGGDVDVVITSMVPGSTTVMLVPAFGF